MKILLLLLSATYTIWLMPHLILSINFKQVCMWTSQKYCFWSWTLFVHCSPTGSLKIWTSSEWSTLLVWLCPSLYNSSVLSVLPLLPTDLLHPCPNSKNSTYVDILHLIFRIFNESWWSLPINAISKYQKVTIKNRKMSINLGIGGWLTIWLFAVDGVFYHVLDG